MGIEWSTTWKEGSDETMMMIEQAKEELQILEAQHPNRFEYLKLELKSFIVYLLESQNMLLSNNDNNNIMVSSPDSIFIPASSTATTQVITASSTNKKRKKGSSEMARIEERHNNNIEPPRKQKIRRDRVEVVIERAQACLLKIQQFKTSF